MHPAVSYSGLNLQWTQMELLQIYTGLTQAEYGSFS